MIKTIVAGAGQIFLLPFYPEGTSVENLKRLESDFSEAAKEFSVEKGLRIEIPEITMESLAPRNRAERRKQERRAKKHAKGGRLVI